MKSPKQEFQEDQARIKSHADIVASPFLRRTLEIAFLQYQHTLPLAPDTGTAAGNWLKLEGAKKLIDIFLNLSEKSMPNSKLPNDNLTN